MYGEMPNLVPLMKTQETVFSGNMTLHQVATANVKTKGDLVKLLEGCAEKFSMYKQTQSQEAFFNNAFCGAMIVCPNEVRDFANCIQQRGAILRENLRLRQQPGDHQSQQQQPPVCQRVKQNLEKCAVRFTSTVVKKSLDSA